MVLRIKVDSKRRKTGIAGIRNAGRAVLKSQHKAIAQAHREATRAFLDAMFDSMLVDTGMSRASLLPLAAAVRHRSALRGRIGARRGARKRNAPTGRFANNTRFVSISRGEAVGRDAFKFEVGTPEKPIMLMSFNISVLQHFLWENGFGGSSARTNSLLAGQAAYRKTFIPTLRRLRPSIVEAFVKG